MTTVFYVDDTKSKTVLSVKKGKKVILRKSFKTLKLCLRWLHTSSKKIATKDAIEELVSMKNFIQGGKFKFKIKEVEDE